MRQGEVLQILRVRVRASSGHWRNYSSITVAILVTFHTLLANLITKELHMRYLRKKSGRCNSFSCMLFRESIDEGVDMCWVMGVRVAIVAGRHRPVMYTSLQATLSFRQSMVK